jgi:hypothetical protein
MPSDTKTATLKNAVWAAWLVDVPEVSTCKTLRPVRSELNKDAHVVRVL